MSRTMYDSITASDIPLSVEAVAGYVGPFNVWSQADWDRFPNAIKVRISQSASLNDGDVLDVESGDATPAQTPGWVRMRQASGLAVPTLYVNRSNIDQVRAACAGLTYDLWLSTLDGSLPFGPGIGAIQYAGQPASGGHYDLSLTTDWWPRTAAPPRQPSWWWAQQSGGRSLTPQRS